MVARELQVFLVRPTKYDDEGYLLRHRRGILPSNTLACLGGLSEAVRQEGLPGGTELRVFSHDESVEALPERRILRAARRQGVVVIVCLVGVQTSQMPRALELARRFRAAGVAVLIGGFHVSGSPCGSDAPAEIRELQALGVVLVRGEVEDTWAGILADAAAGRLAQLYDTMLALPALDASALPLPDPRLMRRFVHSSFVTMDSSRGCPFSCSFCTIIQIQGRKMRARAPQRIAEMVRRRHRAGGIDQYFFTDDDFARSPHWRELLEELIRLREDEDKPIRFLMQSDLLAHRQKDFIELARRAGCFQVFLGMESLDERALAASGKKQNRVAEYGEIVRAWQRAGIFVHAGYIIGFPDDTPASVARDVACLRDEIGVDLASFFLLTPLAGSADHTAARAAGIAIDPDLNRHDTFHAVVTPQSMSRDEAESAYKDAWREFYSFAHRRRRLAAWPREQRATLLQNYLWYACATRVEDFHPMMTGFLRQRPRRDRRAGLPVDGRLRHLRRRAPEIARMAVGYGRELAVAQRLWREAGGEERGWFDFLASVFARQARETGSLRPTN
ncbi:MAG: radical SAM protein [Deltaproteobacteria bacterium]